MITVFLRQALVCSLGQDTVHMIQTADIVQREEQAGEDCYAYLLNVQLVPAVLRNTMTGEERKWIFYYARKTLSNPIGSLQA